LEFRRVLFRSQSLVSVPANSPIIALLRPVCVICLEIVSLVGCLNRRKSLDSICLTLSLERPITSPVLFNVFFFSPNRPKRCFNTVFCCSFKSLNRFLINTSGSQDFLVVGSTGFLTTTSFPSTERSTFIFLETPSSFIALRRR